MNINNLLLITESNRFWGFLAILMPVLMLLLIVFYPLLRKFNPKYKKSFRDLIYKIGLILILAFLMAIFPLIVCSILEVDPVKMYLIAIAAIVVLTYFNLLNYVSIKSFIKEWINIKTK